MVLALDVVGTNVALEAGGVIGGAVSEKVSNQGNNSTPVRRHYRYALKWFTTIKKFEDTINNSSTLHSCTYTEHKQNP